MIRINIDDRCLKFGIFLKVSCIVQIYAWFSCIVRNHHNGSHANHALCDEIPPVTSAFPSKAPVMGSFDAFFVDYLDELLIKQSIFWWFETSWLPCNVIISMLKLVGWDMRLSIKQSAWFWGCTGYRHVFSKVSLQRGRISSSSSW